MCAVLVVDANKGDGMSDELKLIFMIGSLGLVVLFFLGLHLKLRKHKAQGRQAMQRLMDNLDKWEGVIKDVPKNKDIS